MTAEPTFTLADGTVINAITGRPVRQVNMVEIPTARQAVAEVERVRKRVHELPDVPEKMNAVALVALYYMFGLNEQDIAHVSGLTENQVVNIKMTAAFSELIDVAQSNVMSQDGANVRNLINQHAVTAATKISSLIHSEDEKVAMVASKDVLDRSGHRPADVVEHRHSVEGGLTIEYIKKGGDEAVVPPVIIQYEDVTDE